MTKKLPKEKMS